MKEIVGRAEETADVEDGADLGSLFRSYARRFPQLAEMERSTVLARNQKIASHSEFLADGDEVAFLPPVSGGMKHRAARNRRNRAGAD
ncbi:MAG: MoaD/ThiS family protein [Acidobacteria bacterium]|nr:MoaD/ThiS family protein [Acidobacteriota bacterium]